ncbi:MAG: nuclear transport factor 2 family protein [Pseudolabrys sp.]
MDHQRTGRHSAFLKLPGRDSPTLLSDRRFVAKTMLVDGDRAAVLGRLTATKRASGQAISYRIAHFIQFRDEKVVDYVSSFDAVEQLLGYSLDAYDGYRVEGDIVTV